MAPTSKDYSEGPEEALGAPAFGNGGQIRLTASDGAGERLDRFVTARLEGISRSRVQRWIALGAVRCEGRLLLPSTRLSGAETITVEPLPREADAAFEPDPIPIAVLFEDEQLVVIDKPAGWVVHPAPGNWRGTLMNAILARWPDSAQLPRAGIVHRLDKDTSGLMVVGRTEAACTALIAQFAARSLSRRYLAYVKGAATDLTVDAPIRRDPRNRSRMAAGDGPGARPAVTTIRRLALGRFEGDRPVSLIDCSLGTGRTHQIRVHCASRGWPLLGDGLYGGPAWGIRRQALHAWGLRLRHPGGGDVQRYLSVPPEDLLELGERTGIDLCDAWRGLRQRFLCETESE